MRSKLDQVCKQVNPLDDRLMQLRETWNNRLVFPLTELGKRYLRRDYGVLVDCLVNQRQVSRSQSFTLAVFNHDASNFGAGTYGNDHTSARDDDCEFPVFIKSVHVVNNTDRIVSRVAPSVVWLHTSDEEKNLGIYDPLYFSIVSANFIFRKRLYPQDREFDSVLESLPVLGSREMPCDVVEARPHLMDNLAAQDTETLGNSSTAMIVNRLLPLFRLRIGEDWIIATFEESDDLSVEINDVLVGPL